MSQDYWEDFNRNAITVPICLKVTLPPMLELFWAIFGHVPPDLSHGMSSRSTQRVLACSVSNYFQLVITSAILYRKMVQIPSGVCPTWLSVAQLGQTWLNLVLEPLPPFFLKVAASALVEEFEFRWEAVISDPVRSQT